MTNIILCGGSGTRLFPISRKLLPKQFIKLINDSSLFQETVSRNLELCDKVVVVSNIDQYFLARDQLEELKRDASYEYILEPIARNTAPAIALACMMVDGDEILLVSPSDHLIKDKKAYQEALTKAKELANSGNLVTFGIAPTYPETGYGYIEISGLDVVSFKEKPDEKTASEYIKKGNFYWNSGIFCFKAGVFLDELKKYSPSIYEASQKAYESAKKENGTLRIDKVLMELILEDSIDYAVMEKSKIVKCIPCSIGWSDVGSFDSLYDVLDKDTQNNITPKETIAINTKNSFVMSQKLVATIDVDDLIIIDSDDALLVAKKGSSQKVKDVVKELNLKCSDLPNSHLTVHRPWGTYSVLEVGPNYKIKKIVVKPKGRLSLQKHHHRNEHWVVVSGTATVRVGDREYLVRQNESTYIHSGELHRLENRGLIDLVIIEAQVGEYLGEDDIIRIEDDYKR